MVRYFRDEYGNAGSRTHRPGQLAARAVVRAREQVARLAHCDPEEVCFTSGATESNNLAILGLEAYGREAERMHIVSTTIEHKAVLEPLARLRDSGFEIEWVSPGADGVVLAEDILARVRPDTLLVSLMHANNETGSIQPIECVANGLQNHEAYFHVDAAQTFGKILDALRHPRLDLISASAHKVYGPKGIGCLVTRKRQYRRPPLRPLMVGGGQERGLRPGTLPVPLIVGFGLATELAIRHHSQRESENRRTRNSLLEALAPLKYTLNGREDATLSHVANLQFEGVDSEALLVTLKNYLAFSNGAACTSQSYSRSHVLQAMGLTDNQIANSVRLSWSHLTPGVDWAPLVGAVARTQSMLAL
jgi:cysteine desulfurase